MQDRAPDAAEAGPRPTIATWFVSDDADEASVFPGVSGDSSDKGFQDVYWRCVVVFFWSSLRFNPEARHVFYTNAPLPVVDGLDVGDWFARAGIETVCLPITHRLPPAATASFGNQFYLLDVIAHAAADPGGTGAFMLLDSDCLWNGAGDPFWEAIARDGVLTYPLWYSEDEIINGVSRRTLGEIHRDFYGEAPAETPKYFGGELFAAGGAALSDIARESAAAWEMNLAALRDGRPWCREEAQLLSIVHQRLGLTTSDASRLFKRIWTDHRTFRNVAAADASLPLWHLPAEKQFGFAKVFRDLTAVRMDPAFPGPGEDYARYMAREFLIAEPSVWRKAARLGARLRRKLRDRH